MKRRPIRGRSQALQRALLVLRELVRSPWHLPDLAAHLGVQWRTLYRDLAVLRSVGLEVITPGRRGRGRLALYRIPRDSLRAWLERGGAE